MLLHLSRKISITLFILALFTHLSYAQQPVNITPEKPEAGETVTITYSPKHSANSVSDNVTLVFDHSTFYEVPNVLPMQQNDDAWSVSWKVPDYATFASFYFQSSQQTDKGPEGHLYELFVYENNKPAEDAYEEKIVSLDDRFGNKSDMLEAKKQVLTKMLDENRNELLTKIKYTQVQRTQDPSSRKQFRNQAQRYLFQLKEEQSDTPEGLYKRAKAYEILGEEDNARKIEAYINKNYPESSYSVQYLYDEARRMDHSVEKLDKLKNIEQLTSSPTILGDTYAMLFKYYKHENNIVNMKKYAQKIADLDWPKKAQQLTKLAQGFADQGEDLNTAISYATKAYNEIDQSHFGPIHELENGSIIQEHIDKGIAEQRMQKLRAKLEAVNALIYTKQSKLFQADQYFKKAEQLNNSPIVKEYRADYYMVAEKPRKAFDLYLDLLVQNPTDKSLKAKIEKAYTTQNGSLDGFKSATAPVDSAWKVFMRNEFDRNRVDRPAPSLDRMTDLEGNPVSTEDLKNKVVMIDFWATWCGPCLKTFPYIENLYQTYKDNPNVKFVILNTSWRDNLQDVQTWQQQKDYNFPIYYDADSKITESFGVRGIPATYFIGKNGNIQFEKTGFEKQKMEQKMKLRIEMLLEEKADQSTRSKYNISNLDDDRQQQLINYFKKNRILTKAPSFTSITNLQGNPANTANFENKVLVVDFWATWCGSCEASFPYMQELYEDYKEHPRVEFLFVNTGWSNTIQEARKWTRQNNYTFPVYYDQESKVTDQFGIEGIPSTFFIDSNGVVQFHKSGFSGAGMVPKMKLRIEMLLDQYNS